MQNKPFTNSHLIISTDLEPDDILGIITLFSELKKQFTETGFYPSVQFLVGESSVSKKEKMEEIIEAARKDGLITDEQASQIETLNGFSSTGNDNSAHKFYTENFFKTDKRVSDEEIEASRDRIIEKTAQVKAEGKNIVIFAWKPIVDLLALNDALELNEQDQIYLSGSYNIRDIIGKTASSEEINDFLKDTKAELYFFEAFHTYEKNKLPKSIMQYDSDNSDPIKSSLTELSNLIQTSDMSTVQILKNAVTTWNQGTFMSQVEGIFKILKDDEAAFNDFKKVADKIDTAEDFIKKLDQLEISTQNESFSRKLKIIKSIIQDPNSMLICDATTVSFAFNPDIYETTKAGIEFDSKSGYSRIIDDGDIQILTGINDYESMTSTLIEAMGQDSSYPDFYDSCI